MRRQCLKNKLLRYILSLLFSCFVLNSGMQPANWLYLTDQQLSCLDLIQIFFLQQMQNDILQMLIVIHGDFYGVQFSQQNSLCILNVICFSSWSCTWTYLLQQALEGQRHNHTSKLLQQLHPKSVYCNSLFMWFSFFFFFSRLHIDLHIDISC